MENIINKIKQHVINSYIAVNYKKIFPYLHPYLKRAILAITLTIPVGLMDSVIAWSLKPYMDAVVLEKQLSSAAFLPVLIILFSLIQSFLNYAATYLNTWVSQSITNDLKDALFKKMMHFDVSFFDKNTSGKIQQRFNKDAETACNSLLSNAKTFSTRIVSSLGLVCVLFWNSWILAICAVAILFIALIPLATIRKNLKQIIKNALETEAAIVTHYNETYNGNRLIKLFNLYDYQHSRFKSSLKNVFNYTMEMTRKTRIISPIMHFVVALGIALVIWIGSYLISHQMITVGNFVSFITALLMLYHPIKSIGTNYSSLQKAFIAMERVFEKLDNIPSVKDIAKPIKISALKHEICFDNVDFWYKQDRIILNKINLKIQKGEKIALVGNSGGGKSTLVNLLPRFYDVKKGQITFDGINIRDIKLSDLRNLIAMVFQDNFLFTGTIRENIMIGNPKASEKEMWQSIKNACLEEFIESLPNGLDTQVGEKGVLLSGGQKQRIAIARAFLKNAPIVILDEATSALDNKSEAIVQKAIYNLMKDRTVFIIAHRLSTIKNADMIVVVDHGELKEKGKHEELLSKHDSVYATLYKTQLK